MKKLLVFFLITLQVLTFTGCTIPVSETGKDVSGVAADKIDEASSKEASSKTASGNASEVVPATGNTAGAAAEAEAAEAAEAAEEEPPAQGDKDDSRTAAEPKIGRIPVTLYYQDANGFLIPVTRWIEKQQGIAKAALEGLADSALTREELQYYGLYPVIPLDTEVLGISIKEGIATVDFNKNLLNFEDRAGEKNMLASVVYTMTGFKTVNSVRIRVNGFEQKEMKNGTSVSGVYSRANVMINSSEALGGDGSYKADLFVLKKANDMYTYYAPVSMAIKGDPASQNPEKLFEQLLKYKPDDGVFNEIPQNARILNASLKSGILTVDFSKGIAEYGGNAREEALLKQILYTAGQIKDVGKVKILIDGKTAELPEGTDLSSPMNVPAVINDVIDNN